MRVANHTAGAVILRVFTGGRSHQVSVFNRPIPARSDASGLGRYFIFPPITAATCIL
jgi:hypothetical protein